MKRKLNQLNGEIFNVNSGLERELNTLTSYSANSSMDLDPDNETLYSNFSCIIVYCLAFSFKVYNFSYESRLRDQGALWASRKMCQKCVTICHTNANVKGVSHALPRSSMLIKNKTEQQSGFNYFRKGVLEIRLSRMQRACQYCFTTQLAVKTQSKL